MLRLNASRKPGAGWLWAVALVASAAAVGLYLGRDEADPQPAPTQAAPEQSAVEQPASQLTEPDQTPDAGQATTLQPEPSPQSAEATPPLGISLSFPAPTEFQSGRRPNQPLPPFADRLNTVGREQPQTALQQPDIRQPLPNTSALPTPEPAPAQPNQNLPPNVLDVTNQQDVSLIEPEPNRPLVAAEASDIPPPTSSLPIAAGQTAAPDAPARGGGVANTGIPPGFESFLMEQTTVVDVFFGGRFIYSGLATFDSMHISFANPDELANSIPGLIDMQLVLEALSAALPLNENLRCLRAQQTNCGVLYPEVADIIFNSQNYRADLFVNADLLSLQTLQVQPYLGPSSAGFSLFQTLNLAATGSDTSGVINSNLNGQTLMSFGETFARLTSNWSELTGFEIDNLNLQRDWQGMRYQAGLVTPGEDLRFARAQSIVGLSAGTSLDTREDLRFTTGNTIEVFLPLRARVSLFKDNRLVSSILYEAGNHQLDTSVLPGGSYEVEIRIEDLNGIRTETRFYTKSSRLPPSGSPQMSLSIGLLEDRESGQLLATTGEVLWRASYASRVGESTAVRVGGSGTQDQQLVELGWFHTRPGVQLEANTALSNQSDAALSVAATGTAGPFSYNASYRRLWSDDSVPPQDTDLIGAANQQASLGLNMPLLGGSLSVTGRYSEQLTDTTRSLTGNYRFSPVDLRFGRLSPSVQLSQQNGLKSILFTLSLRETRDQWQFSQQSQYSRLEQENAPTQTSTPLDAGVRWRSPEDWRSLLQAGVTARRPDNNSNSLTGSLDWSTDYGRVQAQLNRNRNAGIDSNSWSLRSNTSLVYAGGTVAFGGRQQQQSALIIDLRDLDISDAHFAVMVNDRETATLNPGTAALVPLTPYASYRVRLESRGLALASVGAKDEQVTLYPGNAVKLSWEVEQIHVVFGRLTDLQGNPVSRAVIHGVEGLAVTDESGFFQAELSTRAEQLRAETIGSECLFAVPEYEISRTVGRLGTLACELKDK